MQIASISTVGEPVAGGQPAAEAQRRGAELLLAARRAVDLGRPLAAPAAAGAGSLLRITASSASTLGNRVTSAKPSRVSSRIASGAKVSVLPR